MNDNSIGLKTGNMGEGVGETDLTGVLLGVEVKVGISDGKGLGVFVLITVGVLLGVADEVAVTVADSVGVIMVLVAEEVFVPVWVVVEPTSVVGSEVVV